MSRAWVAAAVLLAACGQRTGRSGSGIVSGAEPGIGTGGGGQAVDAGTVACASGGDVPPSSVSGPPPETTCADITPVLGAPVEHRFTEVIDGPGDLLFCDDQDRTPYPASGKGSVLHRALAQGSAGFVSDSSGTTIGTFGSPEIRRMDVFPTDFGWDVLALGSAAGDPNPVLFLDETGHDYGYRSVSATSAGPWPGAIITAQVSRIPPGQVPAGCGDAEGRAFTLELIRYNGDGHDVDGDTGPIGCFDDENFGFGFQYVDSGEILVLTYGGPSPDAHAWKATWYAADMKIVLVTFTPEGLPTEADSPLPAERLSFGKVVENSVVIAVDGTWRFEVRPPETALKPAPCWLTERPGTTVTEIQRQKGYALTSIPTDGSCQKVAEVLKLDGTTCGFVDLGSPSERCTDGVAVGQDGTITGSSYAVDGGVGQARTCVLPFWPAALGHSLWEW